MPPVCSVAQHRVILILVYYTQVLSGSAPHSRVQLGNLLSPGLDGSNIDYWQLCPWTNKLKSALRIWFEHTEPWLTNWDQLSVSYASKWYVHGGGEMHALIALLAHVCRKSWRKTKQKPCSASSEGTIAICMQRHSSDCEKESSVSGRQDRHV